MDTTLGYPGLYRRDLEVRAMRKKYVDDFKLLISKIYMVLPFVMFACLQRKGVMSIIKPGHPPPGLFGETWGEDSATNVPKPSPHLVASKAGA